MFWWVTKEGNLGVHLCSPLLKKPVSFIYLLSILPVLKMHLFDYFNQPIENDNLSIESIDYSEENEGVRYWVQFLHFIFYVKNIENFLPLVTFINKSIVALSFQNLKNVYISPFKNYPFPPFQ